MSQISQISIAELNDSFRQKNLGLGKVVLTMGVNALSIEQQSALLEMVRSFNNFNEDNDPYDEHDYGSVEFEGEQYLWKIDYYDVNYLFGSDDPGDSLKTRRVMTIMQSSEY